jgi:hypothetical protein
MTVFRTASGWGFTISQLISYFDLQLRARNSHSKLILASISFEFLYVSTYVWESSSSLYSELKDISFLYRKFYLLRPFALPYYKIHKDITIISLCHLFVILLPFL